VRKILTTEQVRGLAATADTGSYPFRLTAEQLARLVAGKFHIADYEPLHHEEDAELPLVRALLLLGLEGRRGRPPVRAYLDIEPGDWAQLPDARDVLARERAYVAD
jgi:hypothetical protein